MRLLEVLLYFALALVITWPLARHVTAGIPLGTENVGTVPLFNLWTLWWNVDRLHHWYQGYWDAPIFHPLDGTFAFSEPQPLTGLAAALFSGVTGSFVVAYNAIILLGLTLNGWAACRLLVAVGTVWPAALAGGAMVASVPFVQQELGVLQLISLAGMIATLHAFVRLAQGPSARRGAILGLAFAATTLMCGYYGLAVSVLLLLGGSLLLGRALAQRGTWKALVAALLVAVPLLSPVAVQQLRIAETYRLGRSASTTNRFSATAEHYRRTPWPQLVPTPGIETATPGARAFWPGTLKVLLALTGLVWGLRRTPRRWTVFCTTVLMLGLLLSFGPSTGGFSIHDLLASFYPGYAQLRSPFRFAVVVQVMVALLAAGGLSLIWTRARAPVVVRALLVFGLGLMASFELHPREQRLLPLPRLEAPLPWLAWVESQTPEDTVIAFLPFPKGQDADDYLETAQWMYWQMRHGRPMVNGYSGFFPSSFRTLKAALENFPDRRSLGLMALHGVRYCVVLRSVYAGSKVETLATSHHRLVRVFSDDVGQTDVYELRAIDRRGPSSPP